MFQVVVFISANSWVLRGLRHYTSPDSDKRRDLFLPVHLAVVFISAAAWVSVQPWQAKCCYPPATKKMPSKFCPTALANQLYVDSSLPFELRSETTYWSQQPMVEML